MEIKYDDDDEAYGLWPASQSATRHDKTINSIYVQYTSRLLHAAISTTRYMPAVTGIGKLWQLKRVYIIHCNR